MLNKSKAEKKNKLIQKRIKKLSKKVNTKAKASESQLSIAFRRFRRNKIGLLGLAIIIVFLGVGILATPFTFSVGYRSSEEFTFKWGGLAPYNPQTFFDILLKDAPGSNRSVYVPSYQAPGSYTGYELVELENGTTVWQKETVNNFLGTNRNSQDLLSRLVLGARISIFVSIVATFIAAFIGIAVGLLSGFYGGRIDELLMRATDIFLNLPFLLIILLALKLFQEDQELSSFLQNLKLDKEFYIFAVVTGLGVFGWPGIARLVRAQIFQIKSMDYVEAARALGASSNRIMIRHIFPNILVALSVVLSISMGGNIVSEAAISFLFPFDSTFSSWGTEISNALSTISSAWWPIFFPGLFITIAVLGFNLLGDALNEAFDPRGR